MLSKGKTEREASRRKVTLSLEAPMAKEVVLMGDFNNWNSETHPMKKGPGGVWKKTLMLLPGRYEYKFLVDGQWYHDPENSDFCFTSLGTCNNLLFVSGA